MLLGWIVRFALLLTLLGLTVVAASFAPGAPGGDVLAASATEDAKAADAERDAPPPDWRSALRLAGGICVAAGLGLLALALLPRRARA